MDSRELRILQKAYLEVYTEGGFPGTPSTPRAGDAGTSGLKMIRKPGGQTGYTNKYSGGEALPTGTVNKIMSGDLMVKKQTPKPTTQVAHFDIFDAIKGYLLDEGYAATEEAAVAIMANMSEEWRENILIEKYGNTETVSTLQDKIKKEKLKADLEDLQRARNARWARNELEPGVSGTRSVADVEADALRSQGKDFGVDPKQTEKAISTIKSRRQQAASLASTGSTTSSGSSKSAPVLSKLKGVEGTGTGKNFVAKKWTSSERSRYQSRGGK